MIFLIELARNLLLIIGCIFLFIFTFLLVIIGIYVISAVIYGLLNNNN